MHDFLKELVADLDTFKARAIAAEAKLKQCQGVREADQVWARRFRDKAEAAEADAALYRSLVADAVVLIAASPRFSSKDPWIARARAALGTIPAPSPPPAGGIIPAGAPNPSPSPCAPREEAT